MKLIYLFTVYFLVDLKGRQMVFCLGNLFLFFFLEHCIHEQLF